MKVGDYISPEQNERFSELMSKPNMKCSIRGGEYHIFAGHEDIGGRKCECCGVVPWAIDPRNVPAGDGA